MRATYVVQRQTYRHGPAPIYSILVSSNTLSVSFLLKWMLLSSRQCQFYCSADRMFSRHIRHICTCGQPTRDNHGPTTVSHWSPVWRKMSVFTVICLNTEKSPHFYEKCYCACIKEMTSRKNEHLILYSTNFSPNTGAFCTGSSAVKQLWLMAYTGRKTYSKAL